jgi:glycosyltransferase involved in cell wall biosynthesis
MKVSVITPTRLLPDRVPMLLELHHSLRLNDCAVEHVVVVDGNPSAAVPAELQENATVYVVPKAVGQATARNFGLCLAQGEWITTADDDDRLPPYSIDQRLAALEAHPGRLWSAGYLSEESRRHLEVMAPGACAPGDVWRAWPSPEHPIPLGPTSLLVERDLLRRVGGWMGLCQGEDLGMMMAVTCAAAGVLIDAWVYEYRMHPGQMTKAPDFEQLESLCRRCAWERGALLAGPAAGKSAPAPGQA